MTPEAVVDIGQQALQVTIAMIAVLLLPALAVGLLISVFQAATQINEVTLSFIPKLLVTMFMLMIGGPWMLRVVLNFTEQLITDIPMMIG
jgi:flagellar biosynthetic protein FliQ